MIQIDAAHSSNGLVQPPTRYTSWASYFDLGVLWLPKWHFGGIWIPRLLLRCERQRSVFWVKFQTLGFFRANDFMVISEFRAAVMCNIGDMILANHLEIPIGKSRGFSLHGRKRIGLGGFEMDLTCICYQKNVIILMVTVTGWEGCNPNESCKHVFTHIDI